MATYLLKLYLLSDTTFGRGDGIAGLIDQEIEHDRYGFPYLRGRTLKGLLSEECDNIVRMLPPSPESRWNDALKRLFGKAGSDDTAAADWHFGDLQLPEDVRTAVAMQLEYEQLKDRAALTSQHVLDSLTTLRRQTAINAETGTPDTGSLRTMRAIMRDLTLSSRLETWLDEKDDRLLLAAGCLALRHVGLGRNRGRGHVRTALYNSDSQELTAQLFQEFAQQVDGTT